MKKKKEEKEKPDKRKIPQLFRAVEKAGRYNTDVYYGYLISDDGFNFVFYGAPKVDEPHFKERIEHKKDYSFSKLNLEEYKVHCKKAVYVMQNEMHDAQLEFEKSQYNYDFAYKKLEEILNA